MASKRVIISDIASDAIGRYFEGYRVYHYGSDMPKRAFNYSLVRNALTHIDAFFDDIYLKNGQKHIDIENICTVEFSAEDNQTEILIKNIYFSNHV
ncbi:MAG: hypothetical protein FWC39_11525 [Bacteroidetes bacterium]|nr:hypothetical protein [Bacteroidota bacterium]